MGHHQLKQYLVVYHVLDMKCKAIQSQSLSSQSSEDVMRQEPQQKRDPSSPVLPVLSPSAFSRIWASVTRDIGGEAPLLSFYVSITGP